MTEIYGYGLDWFVLYGRNYVMAASQTGLWLIGIGPGDLGYITERALKIAKKCDKRYLEGYTAVLPKNQEVILEDIVGPWER